MSFIVTRPLGGRNISQIVKNYIEIFQVVPFAQWFVNTVTVTALSLVGMITTGDCHTALPFRFPECDLFFFITAQHNDDADGSDPDSDLLLFKNFNWIDTYYPLIVPVGLAAAFNIFLMRQYADHSL
ncbi:MAG: hypothetical protein U0350_04050 [Caldilineaceae bacterium]